MFVIFEAYAEIQSHYTLSTWCALYIRTSTSTVAMSRGELYQRVGHCACRHSAVAVAAAAVAAVTRAASRLTDHTRCLRTNGTGVD